ncbi:MAG: hypothetical protein UCJ19_03320, partial [Oscillospiraceae bacterium]|nr:hypothetical protein [Oscillospiraceae bacterium]
LVSLSFDKNEYKILKQEPLYFDHDHLQELKEEISKNARQAKEIARACPPPGFGLETCNFSRQS